MSDDTYCADCNRFVKECGKRRGDEISMSSSSGAEKHRVVIVVVVVVVGWLVGIGGCVRVRPNPNRSILPWHADVCFKKHCRGCRSLYVVILYDYCEMMMR
jgi:hypothetical protein